METELSERFRTSLLGVVEDFLRSVISHVDKTRKSIRGVAREWKASFFLRFYS